MLSKYEIKLIKWSLENLLPQMKNQFNILIFIIKCSEITNSFIDIYNLRY